MIGLQVQGEFLDLSEKSVFNISLINPLFDRDSISRVYSFPLKIPATAHNEQLLEQSARLDSHNTQPKIAAKLFIFRKHFETGYIRVLSINNQTIEIRFENKGQEFIDTLSETNINEILDTINVPFTGTSQLVFDFYQAAPGVFQGQYFMQIDDNQYNIYRNLGDTSNDVPDYFVSAINADYPGLAAYTTPEQLKLNINVHPNIDIHFDTLVGLTLTAGSNIATDKLNSFHDYALSLYNTPVDSHCFPVMLNLGFYGGENSSFLKYINHISNGQVLENVPEDTETWKHTFVPMVRVPYVINKLLENTDVTTVEGTYYESADIQGLLIYNNVSLDEVTFDDFSGGDQYLNHYKQAFDLNDHVPEMTGKEFFIRILNSFQLSSVIEDKKIVISKKIDQVNKMPIDWSSKAQNKYSRSLVQQSGYTIDYDRDDDDLKKSSSQLKSFVVGDGEQALTMPFDTLIDQFSISDEPITHSWLIPVVIQKGTSDAGKLGNNPYKFRLLIDRGKQEDNNGNEYLMAQHGHTAYDNTELGISLAFDGDNGLYENNYKGVIDLFDKQDVTLDCNLTFADILEVKTWANSKRYIYTPRGSMTGIIQSVQFKAGLQGISVSKVVFKKI